MPKRFSWPLAFVVVCLIAAGLAIFFFERITSWPEEIFDAFTHRTAAQAEQIRNTLADAFNLRPRISVNNRVVQQAAQDVMELAVITKDTDITRETDFTWLGSTKHIRIHSTYQLRAGFDLHQKCDVQVNKNVIQVTLPPAKILSAEPKTWNVESLQDGLWNKIQPEDVQGELNEMPSVAIGQNGNLAKEAEEHFRSQLQDKFGPMGYQVVVKYEDQSTVKR